MNEPTLTERAEAVFEEAIVRTADRPALSRLHQLLVESRGQLREPMRVAIVGLIKAGKSTLLNSLLGEAVVATGTVEATFNVNWLKYADAPSLSVHFKEEGREPETKSLAELESLTRRADACRSYLLEVKYIEVFRFYRASV